MGKVVARFDDKSFQAIEATQKELKESIEHSRELAEKSQKLLDRHRRGVEESRPTIDTGRSGASPPPD